MYKYWLVLWIDLKLVYIAIYIYTWKVLKCAFAYYRVLLSWGFQAVMFAHCFLQCSLHAVHIMSAFQQGDWWPACWSSDSFLQKLRVIVTVTDYIPHKGCGEAGGWYTGITGPSVLLSICLSVWALSGRYLQNLLEPNLVWWCIIDIVSHSVMQIIGMLSLGSKYDCQVYHLK